jgi:hypothetical protein
MIHSYATWGARVGGREGGREGGWEGGREGVWEEKREGRGRGRDRKQSREVKGRQRKGGEKAYQGIEPLHFVFESGGGEEER